MPRKQQKSLAQQIRSTITSRIVICSIILVSVIIAISAYDIVKDLHHIREKLNPILKPLEDFTITEVMLNNPQAVKIKLKNFNQSHDRIHVKWSAQQSASSSDDFNWQFPYRWQYHYKLGEIAGYQFGHFKVTGSLLNNKTIMNDLGIRILLLLSFILTLFFFLYPLGFKIPQKLFIQPIDHFLSLLSSQIKARKQLKENVPVELQQIEQRILDLLDQAAQQERDKSLVEIGNIAAQVAHDIRSPLTAINSLMNHTNQLPDQQRTIVKNAVQRINDIANNLLVQYKNPQAITGDQVLDTGPCAPQLIYPLLDSLVSEKRSVMPQGVTLNFHVDNDRTYLSCSKINKIALSRVISNLLNNAIEAIDDSTGEVSLTFKQLGKQNWVIINDTGKGIPDDQQAQLFDKGFSLEKETGSGFGLYYAKQTIESWGGEIELSSQPGQGTQVSVKLPASQPPQWLADRLLLMPTAPIIIVDDDDSIHDVWQSRIKYHEPMIHFRQIEAFEQWLNDNDSDQCLLLIDYEFVNSNKSGLDIIHQYQLGAQATLVTSHFEESAVIEGCLQARCTLLPKNLASFVPIHYVEEQPDCVYIDDDPSVRDAWDMEAALAGKRLLCLANPMEFERLMTWVPYTTPIYIDSNLGYELKGEELARHYYNQGYQTIYLVTGYPKDDFEPCYWIKDVLDKNTTPFI